MLLGTRELVAGFSPRGRLLMVRRGQTARTTQDCMAQYSTDINRSGLRMSCEDDVEERHSDTLDGCGQGGVALRDRRLEGQGQTKRDAPSHTGACLPSTPSFMILLAERDKHQATCKILMYLTLMHPAVRCPPLELAIPAYTKRRVRQQVAQDLLEEPMAHRR